MALKRLIGLAVLLCGCAGAAKPPAFKDVRRVPPLFAQDLAGRRKTEGLSVKIYNTSSVMVYGGAVSQLKSWMSKVRLDVPVFLIRHPRHGLVLFDTGLHPDMETIPAKKMGWINYFLVPFAARPGQNSAAQLESDGIDPARVDWVVISHLHLDHAGSIESFPKATVLVDRREWEAQRAKQAGKFNGREADPSSLEKKLKLRLVDLSSAPPFGSFDHGLDLFEDGTIFLVDLAGHTAGSMGAWINLDSGPALLAGDASWVMDNHQNLALPLKSHIRDIRQYRRRLYMMRAMQEALPQLVVFPGHDLAPLTLQPRPDIVLVPFPN